MRVRWPVLLVVAVLAAACSSGGTPEPTEPPQHSTAVFTLPPAAPTTVTESVGPAGFQDNFCLALIEGDQFTEDLQAMQSHAQALDVEATSGDAYAAGADAGTISLILSKLPKWAPATKLVAAWKKAMDTFDSALQKASDSLDAGDDAGFTKALDNIAAASKQLSSATALVPAFLDDTGLTCP